jgi:fibronectin type 3 domain-containing protein
MGKTGRRMAFTLAGLVAAIVVGRAAVSRIQIHARDAKEPSPGHSVMLNWKGTPGAAFYYVYRSTVSGSQYQKIGSSLMPTFKDAPVPSGAVFYYVVTAVVNGRESKYSNEIKAAVP